MTPPTMPMSAHDHGNCQLCDELEQERVRLTALLRRIIDVQAQRLLQDRETTAAKALEAALAQVKT